MGSQWLTRDWLQPGSRIDPDALSVTSPRIEALQCRQGSIHRRWLQVVGESRAVLAQIMAGGVDRVGAVVLASPCCEAAEVTEVQTSGPGGDLFFSQKGQKGRHRLIGGTDEALRVTRNENDSGGAITVAVLRA